MLRTRWRVLPALLIGAIAGGAYAHFIGCRTGTCPITSNMWVSSAYGALIATLFAWK